MYIGAARGLRGAVAGLHAPHLTTGLCSCQPAPVRNGLNGNQSTTRSYANESMHRIRSLHADWDILPPSYRHEESSRSAAEQRYVTAVRKTCVRCQEQIGAHPVSTKRRQAKVRHSLSEGIKGHLQLLDLSRTWRAAYQASASSPQGGLPLRRVSG